MPAHTHTDHDIVIAAQGLVRRYGKGDSALTVLHGVDLEIRRGEFVAIIGSSGSGKSTLMNLLGALDRPDEGEIWVAGEPVARMDRDALAELRGRRFGFIFQRYHLIDGLDARENVELPAIYAGCAPEPRARRARELLARLGLDGREHHAPHELSGGQCQRVAIARALINDPEVLFADEPTGALDSASGETVLAALEQLNAEGRTIVMVTHDPAIAARALRVIEIRDGRIVSDRRHGGHRADADPGPAAAHGDRPDRPTRPDRATGARRSNLPETPSPPPTAARPTAKHAIRGGAPTRRASNFLRVLLASLAMAWRSLSRNRLRTFLTLIGVLIGVGSVVTLVGIGQGAREQVVEQVTALGSNLLEVRAGARSVRGGGGERARFSEDTLAMLRDVDGVRALSPEPYAAQTVRYDSQDWIVTVQGVDADWQRVRDWAVAEGRFLDDDHIERFALVAVLGATTRDNLFAPDEDPIGAVILIGNSPFRVIGVMAATGVVTGGGRHDRDDQIWVPYTTAGARLFGDMSFDRIVVRADDRTDPIVLERRLVERLEGRYAEDSFHVRNQADALALRSAAQDTFARLLIAIAAIALTVGGIGVMNIMLVSVTERIQEIGVRMAVGARERDVMIQFLAEAVVVCVIGGLIGVAVGLGAGALAASTGDWRMVYSWEPIALALAASVVTGLVFGLWPARKAARLDPVRALQGGAS